MWKATLFYTLPALCVYFMDYSVKGIKYSCFDTVTATFS